MTIDNSPDHSQRQLDNVILPRAKRDHEKPLHWARTAESICNNHKLSAVASLFAGTAVAVLTLSEQVESYPVKQLASKALAFSIATSAILYPVRMRAASSFSKIADKAETSSDRYRTRPLERDRPENQKPKNIILF